MIVMPANQTNELVHLWAGMYGNVGHLYTPARKERFRPWIPFALDNGRFAETVSGREFDGDAFRTYLDVFCQQSQRPMWIAVPDQPFDGDATLEMWDEWEPICRSYTLPLAIVVQDGMLTDDVVSRLQPGDWVFVGGTTEWKWQTISKWCQAWPSVHVGRVNAPAKLEYLQQLGVKSCDGSGWFRGKSPQVVGLGRFLAAQAGECPDYAEKCAKATRYAHRGQLVMRLEETA